VHSHTGTGYVLVILLNNFLNNIVIGMAMVSVMLFLTCEITFSTFISSCHNTDKSSILLRGPPAESYNAEAIIII
jgi:multisubunit Na+/H+ antiporter MnhC subunit